ncbi:hypothetical protein QFC24_003914 [Naganishia onofrii]|uniref:Uncharacterized protein n=1 Tax=Naganishia onofrii TaxID=1851511 RepID=A0ACC2XIK1_9TREE|nr:hypothetical protein QFC24_003914 [Naganishia onofrii]
MPSSTHTNYIGSVSLGPGGSSTFELKIPDSPPPSPASSTKHDPEESVAQTNPSVFTPDRPHSTRPLSSGFHRPTSNPSFSAQTPSKENPDVAELPGSPFLTPEEAPTFDKHGNPLPVSLQPGRPHRQRRGQPWTPEPPSADLPYRPAPAPSPSSNHPSWQQPDRRAPSGSFINDDQPQELLGSPPYTTHYSGADPRNSPYRPYSFRGGNSKAPSTTPAFSSVDPNARYPFAASGAGRHHLTPNIQSPGDMQHAQLPMPVDGGYHQSPGHYGYVPPHWDYGSPQQVVPPVPPGWHYGPPEQQVNPASGTGGQQPQSNDYGGHGDQATHGAPSGGNWGGGGADPWKNPSMADLVYGPK